MVDMLSSATLPGLTFPVTVGLSFVLSIKWSISRS
ncbi:Uncharacterised protein [Mycobacteroides abscessus subsp. abscessus]|nr:Uncharacterised protein [Mycobacteroides abscessus subsp. abscessus]